MDEWQCTYDSQVNSTVADDGLLALLVGIHVCDYKIEEIQVNQRLRIKYTFMGGGYDMSVLWASYRTLVADNGDRTRLFSNFPGATRSGPPGSSDSCRNQILMKMLRNDL